MRRSLVVCLALACGGLPAATTVTSASSAGGSFPSDGTRCGDFAVEYHAAFVEALACDPAAPAACTEWRPITVGTVGSGGNTADAKLTGLCFVAYVGYVTPGGTAPLDAIIARYTEAGCKVGYCPGPSPHQTRCQQSSAGRYTCGGG